MTGKRKSEYWDKLPKTQPHPYLEYEDTPVWQTVRKALSDLETNQDLTITEWHQYVVGYLCRQLAKGKLLKRDAASRARRKTPAV